MKTFLNTNYNSSFSNNCNQRMEPVAQLHEDIWTIIFKIFVEAGNYKEIIALSSTCKPLHHQYINNLHASVIAYMNTDTWMKAVRRRCKITLVPSPQVFQEGELWQACKLGKTPIVNFLLTDKRVKPSAFKNAALTLACENNHLDAAKLLIQHEDFKFNNEINQEVWFLAQEGRLQLIQLLFSDKRFDPSVNDNGPLRSAITKNLPKTVKLLLTDDRVNPSVDNNKLIQWASKNGYADIVSSALTDPRVDPSANHNNAIWSAIINGHLNIVNHLLANKKININPFYYVAIKIVSTTLSIFQKVLSIKNLVFK